MEEEIDRLRTTARADIENLQADLVAKNREVGRLKRELSGVLDPDSPEAQKVKNLLDLWWREIKASDPRVKHDLKSTRAAKVRVALKRRGEDLCRKAVLGVQYDDWAMGRVAKSHGKAFNDIAEHVLNTDGDIEKFAKLYDDCHVTAPEVYRRLVAAGTSPVERKHPLQVALTRLRELGCDYRETSTPGQYVSQCPYHEDQPWTLYVRMAFGRCRMLCSLGCDEYVLLSGAAGFNSSADWQEPAHPASETTTFADLTDQREAA